MATFEQVRQALGRRLGPHIAATATGGSATTLTTTDSRLYASTGITDQYFEDWWILPTSGNEDGNPRLITAYDASAGKFTVTAWSTGPSNGDSFEIYGRMHPTDMQLGTEDALRKMYYMDLFPVSLVTDPAMEDNNTTSWTAANATVTKDTDAVDVLGGVRSLSVVTTSAGGYAQSVNVNVESSQSYTLWVDLRAGGAFTARAEVIDVTNSNASIGTADWDDNGWGRVQLNFSTPAACDHVAVRIVGVENSATIHADNVSLLRDHQHTYALPTWLVQPHTWVDRVLLISGTRSNLSDYRVVIKGSYELFHNAEAANPSHILLQYETGRLPTYIQSLRPFLDDTTVLSGDSATINASVDWVVTMAETETYDRLKNIAPGSAQAERWERKYLEASLRATILNNAYQPQRAPQPLAAPTSAGI